MSPRTGRPIKGTSKRDKSLQLRLSGEELSLLPTVVSRILTTTMQITLTVSFPLMVLPMVLYLISLNFLTVGISLPEKASFMRRPGTDCIFWGIICKSEIGQTAAAKKPPSAFSANGGKNRYETEIVLYFYACSILVYSDISLLIVHKSSTDNS